MAETTYWPGLLPGKIFNKEVNLTADSMMIMLCTSTYAFNQDTHAYKSSVTNEIASGGGYTTAGQALTSVTFTYNTATNTWSFGAANVTWASSTITARWAVIYDNTPATDATRPLIAVVDFQVDKTSTGGPFTITWASGVINTIVVS